MTQTTVGTDLLQSLQILTQLVIKCIGQDLCVTTILDILLSIEEPVWDLVLTRIGHYCHNALNLWAGQRFITTTTKDTNILQNEGSDHQASDLQIQLTTQNGKFLYCLQKQCGEQNKKIKCSSG